MAASTEITFAINMLGWGVIGQKNMQIAKWGYFSHYFLEYNYVVLLWVGRVRREASKADA
jgi:hypothetical protein